MVEVCAIVYSPNIICPIEFAFNVNLATSDGSAGNIMYLIHSQKMGANATLSNSVTSLIA